METGHAVPAVIPVRTLVHPAAHSIAVVDAAADGEQRSTAAGGVAAASSSPVAVTTSDYALDDDSPARAPWLCRVLRCPTGCWRRDIAYASRLIRVPWLLWVAVSMTASRTSVGKGDSEGRGRGRGRE